MKISHLYTLYVLVNPPSRNLMNSIMKPIMTIEKKKKKIGIN